MRDLQTRLEATLSLAATCDLEADRADDHVKQENYRVLAKFYKGVADDLQMQIDELAKSANQTSAHQPASVSNFRHQEEWSAFRLKTAAGCDRLFLWPASRKVVSGRICGSVAMIVQKSTSA